MGSLAQTPGRYLRSPRMEARGDGNADLYLVSWEPGGERLLRVAVRADGEPMAEHPGRLQQAIPCLCPGLPPEPSEDTRDELRDRSAGWGVEIQHVGPRSRVVCTMPSGAQHLVWEGCGCAAAPCIRTSEGGAWIAFHHDIREDTGEMDVAKWICLRFVSAAGEVFEPAAPMVDRNRDLHGEEQGFEFPCIVLGQDGAVALFGRGSHTYWRQDLNARGFGPRQNLTDGLWGSRGRRLAATRLTDGHILVAHRERKAIEIQRLAPATGGAPALSRVTPEAFPREVTDAGDKAHATLDTGKQRADPATRHGLRTLFGDIQQHSAHSDGTGSADEAYLRARYRYQDDFVALTDHEAFIGKRTGPGEWTYLQKVAARHEQPGHFATLFAYEWTGKRYPGPGHKCVYLPELGLPLISRDEVPEGVDVVPRIQQLGGFCSPHHIGWTGADEAGHDDQGQPLWEICSCHGCYEHVDHPLGQRGELRDQMADEMLRRGHRFGFTASSDSHGLLWHHGESRKRDPYRTGLTAVQALDCNREAVMEALLARRCYATSGVKIMLDLRASGRPMGSELTQPEALFDVCALGTGPLARVELMGPDGPLCQGTVQGREGSLRATAGGPWIYARVVQEDGEMAWSSPVFLGVVQPST